LLGFGIAIKSRIGLMSIEIATQIRKPQFQNQRTEMLIKGQNVMCRHLNKYVDIKFSAHDAFLE
jgi:hypothetical protein